MEKTTISREKINEQLELINSKISNLSKKKFRYFIYGKYIPGFGDIKLIETKEELIKCFANIKSKFNNNNEVHMIADELKLNIDKKEIQEEIFLGYTYEEWKEEFQTKASEIQTKEDISKLEKAKKKLKKYLSEDDKLENDFKASEEILNKYFINVNEMDEMVCYEPSDEMVSSESEYNPLVSENKNE